MHNFRGKTSCLDFLYCTLNYGLFIKDFLKFMLHFKKYQFMGTKIENICQQGRFS